jgi:hypothetical protein
MVSQIEDDHDFMIVSRTFTHFPSDSSSQHRYRTILPKTTDPDLTEFIYPLLVLTAV